MDALDFEGKEGRPPRWRLIKADVPWTRAARTFKTTADPGNSARDGRA